MDDELKNLIFQTLKQNTEPASSTSCTNSFKCTELKKKETVSTQTQTPTVGHLRRFNHHDIPSLTHPLVIYFFFLIIFTFNFHF